MFIYKKKLKFFVGQALHLIDPFINKHDVDLNLNRELVQMDVGTAHRSLIFRYVGNAYGLVKDLIALEKLG
jgi:hypothetical protein